MMDAREIMTRPVVRVSPDTPLREAIVLLTEHCVAALPVVDEDDQVLGIFTEADALGSGIAYGGPASGRTVGSVMTTPVEVVSPDTGIAEIGRRMLTDRLRSVPVVADGVLVGIVSRRDMLLPLVGRDDSIASHLNALLTDYSGHRDRWSVAVVGGFVTVSGTFADEAERRVVAALARTAYGVIDVELRANAAIASHDGDGADRPFHRFGAHESQVRWLLRGVTPARGS